MERRSDCVLLQVLRGCGQAELQEGMDEFVLHDSESDGTNLQEKETRLTHD